MLAELLAQHRVAVGDAPAMDRIVLPAYRLVVRRHVRPLINRHPAVHDHLGRLSLDDSHLPVRPVEVTEEEPS
jgi:hypothetical protein